MQRGQREVLRGGEGTAHLQGCSGERDGEVSGMPGSHGRCQCQASTCAPQCYCQKVYKGQLASVHSTATNEQLRKLAATYTYCSLWIGAVTTCKVTRLQLASRGWRGVGAGC